MSETRAVGARRMTADIVAQLVGRTVNIALGVVATVVLIRALGVREYGEWSTLFAVCGLVDAAGSQAMDRVAVPRAAEDPQRESQWLGAFVRSRLLWAVPSTVVTVAVVLAISENSHMRATGLVVALTVPTGALSALAVVFQLRVRNDVNVLITTVNSIFWTGSVLALSVLDARMLPFALAFTAITVATSALQATLGFRKASIDFAAGRSLLRHLIRLSIPIGLFGLAVTAYNKIDQLIVFELAGAHDAGLYSAIYRILDQGGFVPGTFALTITPVLAAAYRTDMPRVRRLLQAAADHLAVISFGVLAFAIVAGAPLLEALYGPEYRQAAPAFAVLMGAYVVICLATIIGTMVVTLNLQKKLIPYALITLAVNVSLNLIFVPLYGYTAAAAITVVTEVLVLGLTVRLLQPVIDLRPRLDRVTRVAVAAAVMGLCVWALRRAGVPLAGLIAASIVIYVPLVFALGGLRLQEARLLLRERAVG